MIWQGEDTLMTVLTITRPRAVISPYTLWLKDVDQINVTKFDPKVVLAAPGAVTINTPPRATFRRWLNVNDEDRLIAFFGAVQLLVGVARARFAPYCDTIICVEIFSPFLNSFVQSKCQPSLGNVRVHSSHDVPRHVFSEFWSFQF